MPAPTLLLRVAAAWPLPGLGLLALPAGPTPHLVACPLHSALAVKAVLPPPTKAHYRGTATVEEIDRTGVPERGLLLEFGHTAVSELPGGTEIWLAE